MERKTASASTIRNINRSAILDFIRKSKSTSCTQISRRLKVSQPTVVRIVDELVQHNFVRSAGFSQETSVGRPHALVEFNGGAYTVIGVDLSGPKLLCAETDLSGNILSEPASASKHPHGDDNLREVIRLIQKLVGRSRPEDQHLLGIGIGVPGMTLFDEGIVTWAASLNWKDLPLRDILQGYFHLPIYVDNDVNLATLGEMGFGAGPNIHNMVCFAIGSRIEAGILIEDTLYRGHNQAAGEVGYLPPGLQYLGKSYPEYGPLETLAASSGIVRRAREVYVHLEAGRFPSSLTVGEVFQAAARGELWALTVVDEVADYLAFAIACVSSILNPEVVILGGSIASNLNLLLEPIRSRVDGIVPFVPRLVISPLGDTAVVLGAINLVLTEVLDLTMVRSFL